MQLNPLQNMLLGIAIGDAFGAGYEFRFEERFRFSDVDITAYLQHPNTKIKHHPGLYTDDMQMSLGVAELLANNEAFTPENLTKYLVQCYKRDPIQGYAEGFQAFLDSISSGEEFLSRLRSTSNRNGAAVRAVPIGIIADIEEVVQYATINAHVTHNTPKGIASSIVVAVLSHLNLYEKRISSIDEIKQHLTDEETIEYLTAVSYMKQLDPILLLGEEHKDIGVPCDGMRTAGAVLYLLSHYQDPKDILREAIRLGGDTDSVASIALGISLMHTGIETLPTELYQSLTNHKYGRDHILRIGEALQKKYLRE